MTWWGSEIEKSGDSLTLYTWGKDHGWFGRKDKPIEVWESFPAIDELRRSLTKRKFYAEILRVVETPTWVVPFLPLAIGPYGIFAFPPLFIAAGAFELYARNLKEKTDLQISAFHKTFPEEKPIKFSPRDYLSAIRIPFRR